MADHHHPNATPEEKRLAEELEKLFGFPKDSVRGGSPEPKPAKPCKLTDKRRKENR